MENDAEDLAAVRRQLKAVSDQLARLEKTVTDLSEQTSAAERMASQVKFTMRFDESRRDEVERLEALDRQAVIDHVQRSIASARLDPDPFPHIVVEDLFPRDFYKLLRKAIPPPVFFDDRDPIKQNLKIPMPFGPTLSMRALDVLENVIARQAICPAVVEKFHEPLQDHYATIFGSDQRARANRLAQSISNGRVMLRRPGYHLSPHRDPKRSMITCLLYLAGAKDSEKHGTHLYRVIGDREAGYTQTYYPEQNGSRCELVKTVPYRSNTMLVFLNATGGAHGASIPVDAPATLERYTYQFYIGPAGEELTALITDLPPERQALWRSKKDAAETVDY
jgi:hypothetical protein